MAGSFAEADDRDLVQMLDRDADALEEFYRRHVNSLTKFIGRVVGDPHDTADLVASTFVAVIDSASRYDPDRGEPRAWLFGIASNLVAGKWRRGAAESRAVTRLEGLAVARVDEFDAVDRRLDAARRADPAMMELRRLSPGERQLIELMLSAELNLTEAAGVLGIKPGTARMRWSRARARLALVLAGGED